MAAQEIELLKTERFDVVRWEGKLPNGNDCRKAIVRHPGAVVILPEMGDGRICLIENFRPAAGKSLIELPAGTREPGETAEQTARRELTEETGFRCAQIAPLCEYYVSPGILDERMSSFVATGLAAEQANRQADESITNCVVPLATALDWIDQGRIEDAKTIATLLVYDRKRRSGF